MRQTKGAIGNLLNRYKAVLKKCNLLNTFGSLAVASMLVMGGAGVAAAVTPEDWNNQGDLANDTVLEGTYDGLTNNHGWYAGVATVGYVGTGISVEDNTHFTNNTTTVSMGGALKILNGIEIGDNVLFESNKASDSAYGGGAIYIKLNNDGEQSANQNVTIGNNAKFINNSGTSWGGAIALEYGNLVIGDGAQFLNNKTSDTFEEAKESGGGAIAVWHDPDNGDTAGSSLSVSKALFDGNSTTVGGGAIYNKDGQIAIDSTQFKNNSSNYHGGAISNESGNTAIDGTITVTDSIFENNSSGNGGAIWQGTDGVATITGSTFQNNTAMIDGRPQQGGAITTASKMHISSTTFTDNKAGKLGGAIANVNPSGLESEGLTLADVTFDGNSAGEKGGALYNGAQNSVTFTGTNVFQNNTANEQANDIHNSGSVTVASGTTSLGSGYSQDKGSLEVNGGATLESLGTMDISGGAVSFANESTFVVNGSNITEQAAIKLSGSAGLDVAEGANLLVRDAVDGQSYNIVDNEGSGTAGEWKNIASSSSLIELSMENGSVTSTAVDAASVLPGLSGDIASQVNGITSIADRTNSEYAGVRFLARATDSLFLGNDAKAAVSTIESAARIAFAGAVPQMTKMASDAATNAVVNRLGFANPDNGAKAMNVDGKLVDDKALGLALWIAPLWSNQTGFGMEAGNLDYGYNANLGGISLGADYTWANNIRAGLMFNIGGGYAESAGGDLSETTNSMTFWGVGAYGGWEYNNFAVMADMSYTSTWNSVDQDVDHRMGMGDLEADIQASAISAGLRFEYKLETQYLDLIPHVGARYMSINTWGYDVETNGGTVLEGDGFQQNIWTFPVGITFSKELEMNNDWYFKPSVDFTVIPAAGDIKAKEDVRFTGLPYSTEIETQMMDYFTWQGGVGLEFGNDNMSVGVNYTLQAGQNSTGHGVFGMFRYEF